MGIYIKYLSDAFNANNSGSGAAAHGIAASSWAVYRAYAGALSDATTKVNNHNNVKGTASAFGHVKLTDTWNSNQGAAASSVAPSSKALADLYTNVSSSITNLQNSINSLNNNKPMLYRGTITGNLKRTESEINTKLNGKSNTDHNHDSRYYTESEMNTKLGDKAAAFRFLNRSNQLITNASCRIFALMSEEYSKTIGPHQSSDILFPGAPELQFKENQQICICMFP